MPRDKYRGMLKPSDIRIDGLTKIKKLMEREVKNYLTKDSKMTAKKQPKSDNVNHPKHYNSHPSGVECITITEHMTFNVGNAIKYLWRAGLKTIQNNPGAGYPFSIPDRKKHIEDLEKAAWYINREIERKRKEFNLAK